MRIKLKDVVCILRGNRLTIQPEKRIVVQHDFGEDLKNCGSCIHYVKLPDDNYHGCCQAVAIAGYFERGKRINKYITNIITACEFGCKHYSKRP